MQTQTAMQPGFFDAPDGLKLYCDWYPAEGKVRAGLIFVHGYADHCGRYADAARHFARQGFAGLAFDYRGHGQAGGRRGHCDDFGEFLGDLDRACARARAALPETPLVLVAHSMGGLIALRALCDPERAPRGVVGLVMSSPFLAVKVKVSPVKVALARMTSRITPRLTMSNQIDPVYLSHDSDIVAARRNDRYCHKVATARWFTETTAAQDYVAANAGRLAVPSLWLVAGDDKIVDPEQTRRVYAVAGGDKQIVWYDGLYHELFLESDRKRVFADADSWLNRRFPAT